MTSSAFGRGTPPKRPARFLAPPSTGYGRRAALLVVGAILVSFVPLPRRFLVAFVAALVGGFFAIVAIVRDGERSALVFVSLLVALIPIAFVVAEVIGDG